MRERVHRITAPPLTPLAASCLLDVPCGYAFVSESLP